MLNQENNFKRVSGVIVDSSKAEPVKHQRLALGEIYINDFASPITTSSENQNFLSKLSSSKNHNGRSDLEIKLHSKSLSIST